MKTIEEINRVIHDGETPPLFCVEDFLDHVTRENFDDVFAMYATERLRIAKDGLAWAIQDGDAAQVEAWRARVKKLAEDDIPRLTAIYQETKARLEQAHAEAEERRIAAHRASKG